MPPQWSPAVAVVAGLVLFVTAAIAKYAYESGDAWPNWVMGGGVLVAMYGAGSAYFKQGSTVQATVPPLPSAASAFLPRPPSVSAVSSSGAQERFAAAARRGPAD